MSGTLELLRSLPYFGELPDELLSAVAASCIELAVVPGTVIIEEGSQSNEMYAVIDGEFTVTKRSGDKDVPLARLGKGDVFGEIALLDRAPRSAAVTASAASHLIRIPADAFEKLLSNAQVVRQMLRTVTSRLRGIEETLRHEERMAALGVMAAQLMHELNNPASSVGRTSKKLAVVHNLLGNEAALLVRLLGGGSGLPHIEPPEYMTPLERNEAEDVVAAWLEMQRVDKPWELAPALVAAGWTSHALAEAVSDLPSNLATSLSRWLGLRALADQMIIEIGIGAARISELVRVVKDYSYLDQAPIQTVDPESGIADTLILLNHKLRPLEIKTSFGHRAATVEAPGRDLNQVWTNLIDNAADAMSDGGTLEITTSIEDDILVIRISDTGPGIPDDIREKVFDPFFTTKEPGKGTGLGLHTVHSIISRIGGEIGVTSGSAGTTFSIKLPLNRSQSPNTAGGDPRLPQRAGRL